MEKFLYGMIAVLLAIVFVLGVGLAYERGHNNGYDEGWNDGTAYELDRSRHNEPERY